MLKKAKYAILTVLAFSALIVYPACGGTDNSGSNSLSDSSAGSPLVISSSDPLSEDSESSVNLSFSDSESDKGDSLENSESDSAVSDDTGNSDSNSSIYVQSDWTGYY